MTDIPEFFDDYVDDCSLMLRIWCFDGFLVICLWCDDRRSRVIDDYVDLICFMLHIWCFDGFFFNDMFVMWWRTFWSFPVMATNWFKPRLFYWLHSWLVAHLTSRMPWNSTIISSDGLLILQFDSNFRIWRAFKIKRLGSLKICIPLGGGPLTCPCCRCDSNTNGKSLRFFS